MNTNIKRKYRIKSKVRFTIFMAIVLFFMITSMNTIIGLNTSDSLTKMTYTEIQIQPGDTLWNIAKEFGPTGFDTRSVIYEICEINHISADSLIPGQKILVPDYI
ncbi:cell division suppressor protein YneA [Sinanaerobacter chloroacetimidivorans]|jgi:cell division protein YceG involved in septum cleavage|uniref:LysM peptidoglycan-binding domain-containing protein n=1 Tax=Sinanaerobacter chloroacetimidivorans TaxID=2818044 RepID=A0A8J7VX11_9FIRM|nr:LysM peptidoglycan-binding domain-containing protein [Sinanaerobacter chloroacetimidivorans]MBR0596609.1 LysM peptidoglycan-binding domain-containing protein [Sinanaerobacter chloroacetimidivorans]